jgi:hypothetical protein
MSSTYSSNDPAGSRLGQIERELAAERKRANRSTTLMSILGPLALAGIGGYFAYGYSQINEIAQPEKLVEVGQALLDENIPVVRDTVTEEVKKNSPEWASSLSQQGVAWLPTGREELEKFCMDQLTKGLDEVDVLGEQHLKSLITKNRAALEKQIEDLADSPEKAEAAVEELQALMEAEMGGSMKADATELLDAVYAARDKFTKYVDAKDLTEGEQLERRILLILRRLQHEQVGGTAPDTDQPPARVRRPQEGAAAPPASAPPAAEEKPDASPSDEQKPAEAPPPVGEK